ncbi:hypothetical protein D3C80_1502730 [compost metagenome]
MYVEYDDALNTEQNHQRAAHALSRKFGWSPLLVGAALPKNAGYSWAQIPSEYADAVLAVFVTRRAMSKGQTSGNPHCRAFGQAADALTGAPITSGATGPFADAYALWNDARNLETTE